MSNHGATPRDPVAELLGHDRAVLVAPAGCGKTEIISEMLARQTAGRHLVLTHTHAGVGALRARLLRKRVEPGRFRVDTIASWALRFASSFPTLSGLSCSQPTGEEWSATYAAAQKALLRHVPREVVKRSYASVFVDEYQDCTVGQHALVTALADLMPCRVLGDPLQGIFGFRNNRLVNWPTEVFTTFHRVSDLDTPWRWHGRNVALGKWLLSIRSALEGGQPIDLSSSPVEWRQQSVEAQTRACLDVARRGGSVVALRQWARDCHNLASKLSGRFTSMEEMDCKDLLSIASRIDGAKGTELVTIILDAAEACMTKVSTALKPVKAAIKAGRPVSTVRKKEWREVVRALAHVEESSDLATAAAAVRGMAREAGVVVYRRELFGEFLRTITAFLRGGHGSISDAAWHTRNVTRISGRRAEARTVSRTLLVKGLEFDHAILADGDELDARNLYVALTRGCRSVMVLSRSPMLSPRR